MAACPSSGKTIITINYKIFNLIKVKKYFKDIIDKFIIKRYKKFNYLNIKIFTI